MRSREVTDLAREEITELVIGFDEDDEVESRYVLSLR